MKRRKIIWFFVFLLSGALQAQENAAMLPVIPLPVSIQPTQESFHLTAATAIYYADESLKEAAALLNLYLGGRLSATAKEQEQGITLSIDSTAIPQPEGYTLQVTNNNIQLTAHDIAGIIHGIQTLRQLWEPAGNKAFIIPGCTITDYPRFAYRGMALDVSRHLFPVAFIKKYIDLLALYKFNTFHWHLTDDQGWRIEIKQYPRLQTIAAWRKQTLIGHKKETPHRFDGKRYGGYYTQQEIKEVVQYATARAVTIIPEIEMPGHAQAALSAYPALGCTGGPYRAATYWGVFDDVYCAGNDSTFTFLQQVLDEVMQLFPSHYIHIGGDECPKTKWQACPKCQSRMRQEALKDEHALQSYFIQRIEKYINSKGRAIIGWDEILEGGLAPNATVMSWRGEAGGLIAAQQKHQVIMTPESHLYFDYYQSLNSAEPLAAGSYTPLQKVYGYQPSGSLPDTALPYLTGVEGQAWSEYYTTAAKAEYMIFPRALALAELAWTPASGRDYDRFLQRLRLQAPLLKQVNIAYANIFDEVVCTAIQPANNRVALHLQSSCPGATIRFTTNNTLPTTKSTVYKAPVVITQSATLQARAFDERGKPIGRIYQQVIILHKAISASVTLTHPAVERFNPGAAALVNGITGSNRYNDAQWLGWSGDDLEAVIDLGKMQSIRSISMHVLNYHWQRIWAPEVLEVMVSTDGVQFNNVFTPRAFPINGINNVRAVIHPVQARYVKVKALNKGIIPAGKYGAGGKALLLMDEIMID
jgi:hexosaminidase